MATPSVKKTPVWVGWSGTAATMCGRARYGRFTTAMHAVYVTMERELDVQLQEGGSSVTAEFWGRFGQTLRRADSLRADLLDVEVTAGDNVNLQQLPPQPFAT